MPSARQPFHAHVYYAADDREAALRLHGRLAAESAVVYVGDLRDRPVGPHPQPQFEIHFDGADLPAVRTLLEASGLRALIHPLTDDDLADHTTLGQWVGGSPLPLDLSVLDPPGCNQGVARFGRSDF